jgi:asparagine synthetase B (glutamine-hydrolysing)
MRLIIAGTRLAEPIDIGLLVKRFKDQPTMVLCGEARGPDQWGKEWAHRNGVPVRSFPVERGPDRRQLVFRNEAMAIFGHCLLAIWDGKSRGTSDMIQRAKAHRLLCYVYRTDLMKGGFENDEPRED